MDNTYNHETNTGTPLSLTELNPPRILKFIISLITVSKTCKRKHYISPNNQNDTQINEARNLDSYFQHP